MNRTALLPMSLAASAPQGHSGQPAYVMGLIVVALVLGAGGAVGPLVLRAARRNKTAVSAYAVVIALCAALLGVAVTSTLSRAAVEGAPVIRALMLGGEKVPVVVVPGRPGYNLVGISAVPAFAGSGRNSLTPGRTAAGGAQTWVGVDLPPGLSDLWVSTGDQAVSLAIDTGDGAGDPAAAAALRGPDGPECASAAVGAVLAGSATAPDHCPADALAPQDAAALRAMVGYLAARGDHRIALAADDSPRGEAAAVQVRATAKKFAMAVTGPGRERVPLVVVAGWTGADAAVQSVSKGTIAAEGTYLAPWLLYTPLLSPSAGQVIALSYAPQNAAAAQYLAAIDQRFAGAIPSSAGYAAWQRARGGGSGAGADEGRVRLYCAAVIYIPGVSGHDHGRAQASWLPDGMITAITGPLPDPA